ncbi:MAG: TonB-dependent siderophore receptor, partial [Halospina sp.]
GYYGSLPAEGTLKPRNGRTISNNFYEGEPSLEEFDREQMMLGYQLEHRFNDTWSARQNLRYMNTDVEYGQVYVSGGWVDNSNELSRTFFGADETLDSVAVDNQLIAEFGIGNSQHTVLTGLDYQTIDTDAYWAGPSYNADGSSTIEPINPFDPQYGTSGTTTPFRDNDRQLEQTGVYLQDQIELEQWRITLSGRHDWIDVSNEYETLATGKLNSQELKESKFSGRAGLLYLFDNGVAPYVSYSESFSPSSNVGEDGDLIEPTEGRQYEAGLKYEPAGTRDRYSVSAFRIDQDNVANKIPDIPAYRAVGSTRSEGVELEATTWLTQGWSVMASYTYTDVTVEESSVGNEGKTPIATPRHMASLWSSYAFRNDALQGLNAALGLRYVGESWANEANTLEVPDYTLVDANLRYDLTSMGMDGVSASLNARNLFDKEYVGACLRESTCYYGAERSVEATITYDF